MSSLSRREVLLRGGRSLLGLSLASMLYEQGLASSEGMETIENWMKRFFALGPQLSAQPDKHREWQAKVDQIYGEAPLQKLWSFLDMDQLSAKLKATDLEGRGEIFHTIYLDDVPTESLPREPAHQMITKIAYIQKGRAVPPHGHSNMVSAFLNLSGEFHIRLYDKLQDDGNSMIVQTRYDDTCGKGAWSSVSDERDNVHWLTACSEDCFLLTTKMIKLVDGRPFHGRINIDVNAAEDLGGGKLRTPRISHQEAAEKY